MNKPQQAPPPRVLNLCADDFGLSPGIAAGIAQLAHAGRISAVSCITNVPGWTRDAAAARAFPPAVAIGLHLNLTEGRPLSTELARLWPRLPSLPRLLLLTHLHRVSRQALRAEIGMQWQAFVAAAGRAPDFIDGHQHVHQLPVVREVVLDLLDAQPWPTAVRSTAHVLGPGHAIKRCLIEGTGGWALGRALDRRRFPHNPALLGVYDFRSTDYRTLMRAWLAHLPAQGGLLFCHPGVARECDAQDHIAAARGRELDYLSGDALVQDLADADVVLGSSWPGVATVHQPLPVAGISEMSRSG